MHPLTVILILSLVGAACFVVGISFGRCTMITQAIGICESLMDLIEAIRHRLTAIETYLASDTPTEEEDEEPTFTEEPPPVTPDRIPLTHERDWTITQYDSNGSLIRAGIKLRKDTDTE